MSEAAPRSVNYADTLPLAISSTQNRRSYYPQNGQAFTDDASNIIRIDVNADGLLDVQQSYLEFTLQSRVAATRAFDQGHCWIKRLTIESGGVILEDINNYNRLVGGILQPAQGSAAYTGEMGVAQFSNCQTDYQSLLNAAVVDANNEVFPGISFQNCHPGVVDSQAGPGAVDAANAVNGTGVMAAGGAGVVNAAAQFTGQYHLACGFLNIDKYLPLVLMGQGFTIQLELDVGANIGVVTGGVAAPYTISNVKYVAHIVEMQRDFYDMMRNLQAQSGGSIMIGGSTYRHFSHAFQAADGGTEEINISARVRSLEALLWCSQNTGAISNSNVYNLSDSITLGSTSGAYNIFIGANRYPSNQVNWNNTTNKGESYQELRKCFGALGSINHGGLLNNSSYLVTPGAANAPFGITGLAGKQPAYAPYGISFRSWRHELEDGIDTSSRALPIRLSISNAAGSVAAAAQTVDIFAQATILFLFNMDGTVTASV
eukprot:SAG11_NODE_3735_length_2257_cov_71.721501_2_plen_487_part_00